jgi:hypothetical protein
MVPNVTASLQRFTTAWTALLHPDAILAACSQVGYTTWRDRVLTPVTTMPRFLWQMLHGNTACSHVPHRSGLRCSAAASGQARASLPRRVCDLLRERFSRAGPRSASDDGRWQGHRPCCVDGSGGSRPDTPALQDAFGQPHLQRLGCGSPVARRRGLLHAGTGVLLKRVVAPLLTHDLAPGPQVHPVLAPGAVLVADRGLCSYAPLALLVQAGVHAVLRVWARQLVAFTPGRPCVTPGGRRPPAVTGLPRSRWLQTLGVHNPLVPWLKPKTCPAWLTREALAALPAALVLREVRDHLGMPGCRTRQMTLVTTRLDAQVYGVAELAELYHQRWPVDTSLAHLKTTRQMAGLHCQTVSGVRKALTVLVLVSNVVRMVMWHSAIRQHIAVERSSVLDARRWLGAPRTGIP